MDPTKSHLINFEHVRGGGKQKGKRIVQSKLVRNHTPALNLMGFQRKWNLVPLIADRNDNENSWKGVGVPHVFWMVMQ